MTDVSYEPPRPLPPPPGWYPDPAGPGAQRWWDGSAWTEHVHPEAGVTATPTPMPAGPPAPLRYPQRWWHLPLVAALAVLSTVGWIVIQFLL